MTYHSTHRHSPILLLLQHPPLLLLLICRPVHIPIWEHIILLLLILLLLLPFEREAAGRSFLLHSCTKPIMPLHQAAGAAGPLAASLVAVGWGEGQIHNNMPKPMTAAAAAAVAVVDTAANVQ
jgi:hypothetical protein